VWEPQSVRAVAVAKALSWEREREIPRALVEYPSVGVVREVRLTTRKKAAYRRALRAARSITGHLPESTTTGVRPATTATAAESAAGRFGRFWD